MAAMEMGGSPGLVLAAKCINPAEGETSRLCTSRMSNPRIGRATLAGRKLKVKACGLNFTVSHFKPHNWLGDPLALTKGGTVHGFFLLCAGIYKEMAAQVLVMNLN